MGELNGNLSEDFLDVVKTVSVLTDMSELPPAK